MATKMPAIFGVLGTGAGAAAGYFIAGPAGVAIESAIAAGATGGCTVGLKIGCAQGVDSSLGSLKDKAVERIDARAGEAIGKAENIAILAIGELRGFLNTFQYLTFTYFVLSLVYSHRKGIDHYCFTEPEALECHVDRWIDVGTKLGAVVLTMVLLFKATLAAKPTSKYSNVPRLLEKFQPPSGGSAVASVSAGIIIPREVNDDPEELAKWFTTVVGRYTLFDEGKPPELGPIVTAFEERVFQLIRKEDLKRKPSVVFAISEAFIWQGKKREAQQLLEKMYLL